jgi:hypothetical protein
VPSVEGHPNVHGTFVPKNFNVYEKFIEVQRPSTLLTCIIIALIMFRSSTDEIPETLT